MHSDIPTISFLSDIDVRASEKVGTVSKTFILLRKKLSTREQSVYADLRDEPLQIIGIIF